MEGIHWFQWGMDAVLPFLVPEEEVVAGREGLEARLSLRFQRTKDLVGQYCPTEVRVETPAKEEQWDHLEWRAKNQKMVSPDSRGMTIHMAQ
ncbi:MAG: hypothetical protein C4523_12965 [Myxococcales bacterium]|nr:MAG: hypothetical protein C4523_12965 [Myxococcales bacterium]